MIRRPEPLPFATDHETLGLYQPLIPRKLIGNSALNIDFVPRTSPAYVPILGIL
jgi:hypothetical protein